MKRIKFKLAQLVLLIFSFTFFINCQSNLSIGTGFPVPIGPTIELDYEYKAMAISAIGNLYTHTIYVPAGLRFAINEDRTFYGMIGYYIANNKSWGITFGSRTYLNKRILFKWTFGTGIKQNEYDGWGTISLLYRI